MHKYIIESRLAPEGSKSNDWFRWSEKKYKSVRRAIQALTAYKLHPGYEWMVEELKLVRTYRIAHYYNQ